jgi:hypothetical protein
MESNEDDVEASPFSEEACEKPNVTEVPKQKKDGSD